MGSPSLPLIVDIKCNSLDDGPGIRTVLFFKGCPLSCVWCQNPETISPFPEIMFSPGDCLACGACEEVCPQRAIDLGRLSRLNPTTGSHGPALGQRHGSQLVNLPSPPGRQAPPRNAGQQTPTLPSPHGEVPLSLPEFLGATPSSLIRPGPVDWERCQRCGTCAAHCPSEGLRRLGRPTPYRYQEWLTIQEKEHFAAYFSGLQLV
ncbi:MAG: 4Fe-4S binding protein [Firmicutes bacterium]|nr:4Fe-4S binding protein [Bacillota bacterium]